jgi:hypothetical protein
MGFGLVNGFTGLLKLVTAKNYSAIANSSTLQFTIAHTKSSQFLPTMSSTDYVMAGWRLSRTLPMAPNVLAFSTD